MVYIFLGPSGSGKDTQAKLLVDDLGVPRVSVGSLFRKEIATGSELGKKLDRYVSKGEWVPDDSTVEILEKELTKDIYKNGFIITGFPRMIEQGLMFDDVLNHIGQEITAVVHFDLNEEESMKRMKTQAHEENRSDTTEEAMRNRYESYLETINPILAEYEKRGLLTHVDAAPSVEEIQKEVREKLKIKA